MLDLHPLKPEKRRWDWRLGRKKAAETTFYGAYGRLRFHPRMERAVAPLRSAGNGGGSAAR